MKNEDSKTKVQQQRQGQKLHAGFGVIAWAEGEDPFGKALVVLENVEAPELLKEAAVLVHADLTTARAIALSIFGTEWKDFAMDVYDRLQTAKDEVDDGGEETET